MRPITHYLLTACCYLALTACGHSTAHNLDTNGVVAAPTPPTATPPPSSIAAPETSVHAAPSPTATTPLLTGAAVSPGEHPPTISAFADHDNASGALAFTAYFYKALDWSIATTNPNLLRPISAPDCTTCQYYIHGLDSLAAAGGHSVGGRMRVTRLSITTGNAVDADYVVEVVAAQSVEVIVQPGAAPSTYPPTHDPFVNYLYMKWRGSGWQAIQITRPTDYASGSPPG